MWPMLKSVTATLHRPESVRCWPETLSSLSAGSDFNSGRAAPLILLPPNERCSRWSRLVQDLEQVVVHAAVADVQELSFVIFDDVLEERAGDLRAADVQMLQVLPVLQVGDAQVGDGFGVVQVEHLHVLERGQVLQPQVGDLRVGQVDALQLRQARQLLQVGIGHPGVAQIDADRSRRRHRGQRGAERVELRDGDRLRPKRSATSRPGRATQARAQMHRESWSSPCRVSVRSASRSDQLRRRLGSLDLGSKMISHCGHRRRGSAR